MSHTNGNYGNGNSTSAAGSRLGIVMAFTALTFLASCDYNGDHNTTDPQVNPAMEGSPQESDHTNTDVDDLKGGYGTGTGEGVVKDDNIERTQGSPIVVPAAKDSAGS